MNCHFCCRRMSTWQMIFSILDNCTSCHCRGRYHLSCWKQRRSLLKKIERAKKRERMRTAMLMTILRGR